MSHPSPFLVDASAGLMTLVPYARQLTTGRDVIDLLRERRQRSPLTR